MNRFKKAYVSSGIFFLIFELVILTILLFGDIGFDLRGKYGLSFWHFIVLLVLYSILLCIGVIWALANKEWKTALIQVIIPSLILIYFSLPPPEYNASNYQFLISKHRKEVEKNLGARGIISTGKVTFRGMDCEVTTYNGMRIYYSPKDSTVIAVEAIEPLE